MTSCRFLRSNIFKKQYSIGWIYKRIVNVKGIALGGFGKL